MAACSAAPAQLDNTYLPPGSASSAGGSGNFLAAPRHGSGHGGSFAHGGSAPTGEYGAPAHGNGGNFRANGGHSGGQDVPIVRFDNENNGDGSYHYQ